MTNVDLAQFDNEIIGATLLKVFNYRLAHPTEPMTTVCAELGLNYRTITAWIADGKMTQYLAQIHDARSDLSQAVALNSLPEIVQVMAEVATGRRTMRGGNPQEAAKFVLQVAQLGARMQATDSRALQQVNVYVPVLGAEQATPPPTIVDA